jgi:peptidoglycan-associated lipoprotein
MSFADMDATDWKIWFKQCESLKGDRMQKKIRIWNTLPVLILALVFFVSCSKQVAVRTTGPAGGSTQGSSDSNNSDQKDLASSEDITEGGTDMSSDGMMMINIEDVYFEFDRSTLTREAQEILTKKALWLKSNSTVKVVIEGHCDDRGTSEYNLALGDRRAASTKAFLIDLGVSPSRMMTISYGEERPLITGQSENAWAKNRRAHFEVE